MREAARTVVESVGVGLIILACALVYLPLAALAGGILCVILANFYMTGGDAEEGPDADSD